MKRILSFLMILATLVLCALPATAATPDETSERVLDVNFNFSLATTLIVVICSVLAVLLLAVLIFLARRNRQR